MSDSLGPIPIPDPPTLDPFPFETDYGGGFDYGPPQVAHVFDAPELKTEQRYLLGSGVRRFRVVRARGLACQEYEALKSHFAAAQGGYGQFPYRHWLPNGAQDVTARYENPNIAFNHLVGMLTADPGITLLEVPTTTPVYTSVGTIVRFPDSTLTGALRGEVQQLIPLVTITPRPTPTYTVPDVLRLSNGRCTVDGALYLPRLLEWSGIKQTLGEASDSATFTFGNADDIWVQFANQINLYRARVTFGWFHRNTNQLVKFWSGYARPWNMTSDGKFVLPTSDGVFELGIPYPSRTVTRRCWKDYKGRFCPSTSSLPDCPKDFASCTERGVPLSFGGVDTTPPEIRIREQATGVIGYGRSTLSSISVANDTIYQRPVQEVYTDEDMIVTCDVAAARDENEFYAALGVVSEGPIGAYSNNLTLHKLDGSPPHDPRLSIIPLPQFNGGWRGILGTDPAIASDFFAIDQAPWVPSGPPGATYAAGLAFAEIRRTDASGLQLRPVAERKMEVTVTEGIGGWVWSAPGVRTWQAGLSNTIWVAINVYLRGIGLRLDHARELQIPAATMEQYFDVTQAIAMAAICETSVPKLIGDGDERQFPFRGVLKEQKPLKDWLQEILNCCLGYYTFVDGKLWVGIRHHSNAVLAGAFTQATILYGSLQATPLAPQFTWLDGQFGDEEFLWQTNTVSIYDIDAAKFMGSESSPMYTRNTMTFVGISNKSQCARVITTRFREEVGGITLDEQRNARNMQFKTTLLAMEVMAGDIVSITHPRLPGGKAWGRVQEWTLNPDYSIDITASATTDSMYNLDAGDRPVDVAAPPVPSGLLPAAQGLAWMPNKVAPFASDPLYPDILERTFDLWQDYSITRDGKWEPAAWVSGEHVINHMVAVQPRISVQLVAGGTLAGPQTVYAAVGQHGLPPAVVVRTGGGIALVAHSAAGWTDGSTPGINTTGTNLLVCALTIWASSPATLTDSFGNTWIPLTAYPGSATIVQIYYCCPPSSKVGSGHTFNNSSQYGTIEVAAFAGVDATSPFIGGTDHGISVAFPLQPGSVTPGAGDLVISVASLEGVGIAATVDSGLTITDMLAHTAGAYFGGALAYLVAPSAGAINPTWSASGGNGAVAIACFRAAAVTPPPSGDGAAYTVPSNLVAVWIPAGATGQALKLTMSPAAGTWSDWDLYVGNDRRQMPLQLSTTGSLPSSYTFAGPIHPMTREMPEAAARRVRVSAKLVHHSGVAGVTVTGTVGTNQIQCNDFIGSTDTWTGRIVSALADFSDGSAPLWNFTVTGFDSTSGTLTVSPGFAGDPVDVGDVLIVRSKATAAGPDYVEDSMWVNYVTNHQFGNDGLLPAPDFLPDQEKGRLCRILRGKGAGQIRQITGNTNIRIKVHPDWDVQPDNTSVIIVEAPEYPSNTETSDFDVPRPGVFFDQRLRLENLSDKVVLVTGFLVDTQGRITDDQFAVHREIYIYGEPPHVRDIGPAANDPATGVAWLINEADETIRVDTSANDVNVKLLPLVSYHGRELKITNNNGPHNAIVTPTSGDPLFDASTTVTIAPLETARFTSG